ncbi:hypothetical protein [Streptococcus gallolyticus]|uniref:hypothetical protein n=1 Tax=Streptococcus gallolyticus TaxID=315405 RepID=UPI0007771BA4|nr:hypothetical protein [Streptococcus gallolyticus]
MIANIRIRDSGYSEPLCKLDLMHLSEEQIRERMRERGFDDKSFFVCGFVDWGVDTQMGLSEAYGLKRCIQEFYHGDESIVIHLLKEHIDVKYIVSHYYRFISKDEYDTALYLLEHTNISQFMLAKALDDGVLASINGKGFYIADIKI